jgi:hypothetical protein
MLYIFIDGYIKRNPLHILEQLQWFGKPEDHNTQQLIHGVTMLRPNIRTLKFLRLCNNLTGL